MKKILSLFMGILLGSLTLTANAQTSAKAIDDIASYKGDAPFVYSNADGKFYALNNLNEYEEYGVYAKTGTLKVKSATNEGTEIQFIRTHNQSPLPYINLNYIPKANTRVVATLMSDTGDDWKAAFGCGYEDGGWKGRFCFFPTNAVIDLGGETGSRNAMRYYRKVVVEVDGATGVATIFDADGTTVLGSITDSPKSEDCSTPLYVFAQNKDVPGGAARLDCQNPYLTLYGMKIYEGSSLVMDLVPYVNEQGKAGLKDKVGGQVYTSANNGEFLISDDLGVTVYEGKLVLNTTDGHLYKYTNGSFVDQGERTEEEISDDSYKNLNNWKTNDGHADIYRGNIKYENGSNRIDPYVGTGGHEPLEIRVPTEAGADYNFSFVYSGSPYNSWHNTEIHTYVWNDYNLNTDVTGHHTSDQVLATASLPFAGAENMPISLDFQAEQETQTLVYQFGDGDDGKTFWFQFDNLKVVKYGYPAEFDPIDVEDPNKYTPLAYIESNSAERANVFTTPYKATSKTEVGIKFNSYGSGGWRAIFSGRNGSSAGNGISLYQNGNGADFGYFVGGYTNDFMAPYPGNNKDVTVVASLASLNVDGKDYPTGRTDFNASTRNISLFANPEWDDPFRGRIYYFTIKEDGKTLYDFQPAMRHDGAFGYYDKGSKTFITSNSVAGYDFKLIDDQKYVFYKDELRTVVKGTTAQFLPFEQNMGDVKYTWTSEDESIATVAADGTVTGKKVGKVNITAQTDEDNGWTATYELQVIEMVATRTDADGVGYMVIAGGNGWGDSPYENILDNDATTKYGASSANDYQVIMMASEPVAVKEYAIVTGADTYNFTGRNPRSWVLEGSTDNQNWEVISEVKDDHKLPFLNSEEVVYTVNSTKQYEYFKFNVTEAVAGIQISEVWINAQKHEWGEPTVTEATCAVDGKKVYVCALTKAVKTEIIPATGEHSYKDGKCEVCGQAVATTILLADGQTNAYTAKYRHMYGSENNVEIEAGWNTADFDDSAWDEITLPIGSDGYDNGAHNGARYNTNWYAEYNTFWFRRTFEVTELTEATKLEIKALHDDDYIVFVNGTEVKNETGWTDGTGWRTIEIDPSLLTIGKNVLAVYIEQNFGGAYFDISLTATMKDNVKVGDKLFATYVAPFDVDIAANEDLTAYAVSSIESSWVTLTEVESVPQGAAVVVEAAQAGSYTVDKTADATIGTNELKAATEDVNVTEANKLYVLNDGSKGVGFYPVLVGTTIPAGKGYLEVTDAGAKFYPLDGSEATAVEGIIVEKLDGSQTIYNLSGQKLGRLQHGINIVNGKKVIVK